MFDYYNGHITVQVDELGKLDNLSQEEANNLATGPQDMFFERLNSLNTEMEYYNIKPIDVTSKWNWKPGSYDKVKEYLTKRLDLHKKSQSISKLIDRTRERMNYLNYIQRRANDMERERANLKRLGVSKDVDIDKFKEVCKAFVDDIISKCEVAYEMTNQKVLIVPYIEINGRDTYYYLDVVLNDLTLSIYDGKEDIKCIQEIPLQPIHIIIKQSLRHKLNNQLIDFTMFGKYKTNGPRNEFVYISKPYRSNTSYGTVCLDKHYDDIKKALNKNDLLSLSMFFMNWAQYYNIKRANPYNQPFTNHLGVPKSFSKEYLSTLDTKNVSAQCSTKLINYASTLELNRFDKDDMILKACNNIKCQLRNDCKTYKMTNVRCNNRLSDYGYQAEGMAGWIIEVLEYSHLKESFKDYEILCSEVHGLIGYTISYWSEKYKNDDDSINLEILLSEIMTQLFWYYISSKPLEFDIYTFQFLEKYDLIDKVKEIPIDTKIISNDEIESLMKQWAASQGRR